MPLRSRRPAPPLLASLLAVLVASRAAPSFAEPAPSTASAPTAPSVEAGLEQRRAAAKAKYQQGADAYSAGHFKDAVDFFLQADALAPSAPLSFNVARAYENLGDDAGALRWYRDYLRRAPGAKNESDVRFTVAVLASSLAKKGVQQLTVISSPAGATLSIDGRAIGVAPWTGELGPGRHHLLLTSGGYDDLRRDIDLPANEPIDVSVRLEPSAVTIADSSASSPSSERKGPRLGALPWVALGVGGAALGGSLIFEVLRRSAENDANRQVTQLGYQSRLETEQGRQTAARVLLGVGAAFVVAGGVMLVLDSDSATHTPTASAGFVCLPQQCGLSARGKF